MNRLQELRAIADEAHRELHSNLNSDALYQAAIRASDALSEHEGTLHRLSVRFEELCKHPKVCTNTCIQNARDAGFTEDDLDYWHSCIADAQCYINGDYDL